MINRVGIACIALLSIACAQEDPTVPFRAGEQFLAAGRAGDAVVAFRSAVALNEQWGEARYQLARAYAADGATEYAYREYLRAADLLPDDVDVQLTAASQLLQVKQYEDASARAQRVVAKQPANLDARIAMAQALLGLKRFEEALEQVNAAITTGPARAEVYSTLASIYVAQGENDRARAAFAKAVETDAKSIEVRVALADFEWSRGDVAAAERTLKLAHEIDPADARPTRALSAFYLETGRPKEAEPHLKTLAQNPGDGAAKLALADYYGTFGRVPDATAILEPLARRGRVKGAARVRLAEIAYSQGKRADAHRMIDALLAAEPQDALALLVQARWFTTEGRVEEALQRTNAAISASPRMSSAYYLRGVAEIKTRRSFDALNSLSEALRLDPTNVEARIQLSAVYLSRLAVDSAALFAEEAVRTAPNNMDARLALVRAWIAGGSLARARDELRTLRKPMSGNAVFHSIDGTLHMVDRDLAAARQSFERALSIDPSLVEPLESLVRLDLRQGRVKEARTRVEASLAARPTPELLLTAGEVFRAAGDLTAAATALRKSIDADPLQIAAYPLLVTIYTEQGKLDHGRAECDAMAQRNPRDIGARLIAAVIDHNAGKLDAARSRYTDVLSREPRAGLAANNLAAILAEQDDQLDAAQQLAERAAEQWPAHADVQDTLGWVYYRRQWHGKAVDRFQQSITADPRNPVFRYHLGLAYQGDGNQERAKDAFTHALRLNPQYSDARRALAALGL